MTATCARVVVSLILALVTVRLVTCQSDTCSCDTTMQREALAALYSSTSGAAWHQRGNWMSPTASICSWYGVSCSGVNLTDNNLVGTLPLMLSQLTDVAIFSVARNPGLRGTLPAGLSNWTSLNTFDVASCGFEGTLPDEFRLWTLLTTFVVDGNKFGGTLPLAYSAWINLQYFRASANDFVGTLPASFTSCTRLHLMDVSNNRISGTLPSEYSAFAGLAVFSVSNNSLEGWLPEAYRSWTQILTFTVSTNKLNGTLPAAYSSWTNVQFFLADTNAFQGTMPPQYRDWGASLIRFCVSRNDLSGTLPPEYKDWTRVGSFEAALNSLSGSLPVEYGSTWKFIKTFFVATNMLTGTLPVEYASWGTLQTLMLYQNRISGTIPVAYKNWRAIAAVSLGANELSGTLSPEFGMSWQSLYLLTLSTNKLSGSIPSEFGRLSFLVVLMLDNNNFSGTLPTSFAPKFLIALSLHNNTEFGEALLLQSNVPAAAFVSLCHTRFCGVKPKAWALTVGACKEYSVSSIEDAQRLTAIRLPEVEVPQCEIEPRPPQSPAPTTSGHRNVSETTSVASPTLSPFLRSTTSVAAIVSGGLGGPSDAFVLRRLLLFPVCGVDALAAGVEWSSAPLQVSFGSTKGAAHRGAAVGNVLVFLASFVLAVVLVTLVSFKKQRRCWCDRTHRRRASLWPTAGRLRLPGALYVVVGVLYQQTWLSVVILLASGGDGVDIAVGVFGLAVLLLIAGVAMVVLVVRFHARSVPFLLVPARGWRKGLQWLAGRRVEWLPAAEASRRKVFGPGKHFVECYGYLFRSCVGGRQWWLGVDVVATSILATLAGTAASAAPESSSCRAQQWLFVVVCGALCVGGYVLRPKQRRVALGMLWLSDGALFVISLVRALTSDVDNVAYEAAATTISVLSLLVSLAVNVVDRLFRFGVDTTPADADKSVHTIRKGARRGSSKGGQRPKRHDGLRSNALRGLDDSAPRNLTNCSGSLLHTVVLACAATYCRLGGTNDTTAALRVLIETAACVRTRSATRPQEVCTGTSIMNLL